MNSNSIPDEENGASGATVDSTSIFRVPTDLAKRVGALLKAEPEALGRSYTSSEILLLEALHVASRRQRLSFAAALLVHRLDGQHAALERAQGIERLLDDSNTAPRQTLVDAQRDLTQRRSSLLSQIRNATTPEALLEVANQVLDPFARTLAPPFPATLLEEIDRFLESRHRAFVVTGPTEPTTAAQAAVTEVHEEKVPSETFVGLSLSGGGIRSASFSLGALESLAKAGLLPGFDFVSSVSGGGYAAAWLTAWAYRHRSGIVGVQDDLFSRRPESSGPLRWVRRHCAYLAPRLGSLLSSDGWALFVAYASNWIPIVALLSSTLVAVLLVPHLVVVTTQWLSDTNASIDTLRSALLVIAVALFLIFGGLLRRLTIFYRVPRAHARFPRGLPEIVFYGTLLVTLTITAAAPVLWSQAQAMARSLAPTLVQPGPAGLLIGLAVLLLAACLATYAVAQLFSIRAVQRLSDWLRDRVLGLPMVPPGELIRTVKPMTRVVLAGLVSALVGALILTWMVLKVNVNWPAPLLLVTFAPLALVVSLAVSELAGLVLLHKFQHDRDRAWAARVGGWMLAGACVWIVVCGVSLGAVRLLGSHFQVEAAMLGMSALLLACFVAWRALGSLGPAYVGIAVLFVGSLIYAVLDTLLQPLGHARMYGALSASSSGGWFAGLNALTADEEMIWIYSVWLLAVGVALSIARASNVNRFSLHALYKEGLVRTFLAASRLGVRNQDVTVRPNCALAAADERNQFRARRPDPVTNIDDDDDPALWWLVSRTGREVPILLLNAAVNGRSVTDVEGRVPRQWPFTFSQHFCGSPVAGVGYARSDTFFREDSGKGLTLGTAMAVSGAAMSPTSGRSTHPLKAFILGILNARLGLWVGNPQHPTAVVTESPNLAGLAVLREMLGIRTKFSKWIHLSDGGHFENLGVYELVRRGCRRIVAIDASCDPKRGFSDLANSIRRVRIDLGIRIYRSGPWQIHTPAGAPKTKDAVSRAWTWFEIDYGPGLPRGRLLYVKPSVYNQSPLPVEVRNYWGASPSFPHETTADQFFTEAQMEAYRSLGQACVDDAMALVLKIAKAGAATTPDTDAEGLLKVLARTAAAAAP